MRINYLVMLVFMLKQKILHLIIVILIITGVCCCESDNNSINNKSVQEHQKTGEANQDKSSDKDIVSKETEETEKIIKTNNDNDDGGKSALDILREEAESMRNDDEDVRKLEAQKGDIVSIYYTGKTEDGTEFGSSYKDGKPLVFKLGSGKVIEGLEEAIIGMKKNEGKVVRIPPDKAYGDNSEEYIITIPLEKFGDVSSGYKVGDTISVKTPEGDFNPIITKLTDEKISLDFSHKLAGEALIFDIELIDINR